MKNNKKLTNFIVKFGTIFMVIIVAIIFQLNRPMFLSVSNITNMLKAGAILIVMSSALTLIFASGGFDLSLGAIGSTAGMVVAALLIWFDWPPVLAIAASLAVGLVFGYINGILIVDLGIGNVLATLGTSFVLQGAHLTLGQGNTIHNFGINPWTDVKAPGMVGDSFRILALGNIGPVPILVIISMGVERAVHLFLEYTKWGRYFFVIGGNEEAGFLSGVNVGNIKKLSFALGGMLAALAGVLVTARIGSGQIHAADNYTLMAILAVFVGFTVFGIGKPNILGTVIGALFATMMINGLVMMGVHPYTVDVFRGSTLILAVTLQSYQAMKAKSAR